MVQVFGKLLYLGKLHASGFRQVAILGQVACFRFSASCYAWASCMLQVFGKLLRLGKLHASGFRQVATLGQVVCFRVILASCYTWGRLQLQGGCGSYCTQLGQRCIFKSGLAQLLHMYNLQTYRVSSMNMTQ